MKSLIRCLFICLLCCSNFCNAAITVNSVSTTISTCPNNGTATIHAQSTSSNAVFLYDLVSGPVTYPQQNDSVFTSLYPGNYAGWVHDVNSFDSTEFNFTITGTYVNPVVSAQAIQPLCNDSSGIIVGKLTPGTGLGPYQWQIYQPDSGVWQQSDTFSGLPMNNYVIRLKDACGIARIANAFVDSGGTGLNNGFASLAWIGCHTFILETYFNEDTSKGYLPLTITAIYDHDTVVKHQKPVPNAIAGQYYMFDTLYNINFGDILHVTITDTCGKVLLFDQDTILPFHFVINFINGGHGCAAGSSANIYPVQPNTAYAYSIIEDVPVNFVLTNAGTGAVVASFQDIFGYYPGGPCYECHNLPVEPDSIQFILSATDACGDTFSTSIEYPPLPSPSVLLGLTNVECIDSTIAAYFYIQNLGSNGTVTILSGPSVASSNRPGFAYYDTLIYPITYANLPAGTFVISNMPAGTYTIEISDSCGFSTLRTLVILPSEVQVLKPDPIVHNLCNGYATITIGQNSSGANSYSLINLNTHQSVSGQLEDTVIVWPDLPPAKYMMVIDYGLVYIGGAPDSLLKGNNFCWVYRDTINLPYYNDSTFKATDIADCNGTIFLHIEVDSANGLAPFRYEITSGPETFVPQDTPNFTVYSFGTYLIGVIDSCGNIDARYITVDTGRIDPVVQAGGLCVGGEALLTERASPYFTYTWYGPHGQLYTGDSVYINPMTPADTGYYMVKKVITINGCRDSAWGNYYLTTKNNFSQSITVCAGDTVYVGHHPYVLPGTYTDTLAGAFGCDSIETTTIINLPAAAYINDNNLAHCHLGSVALYASGGSTYNWGGGNTSSIYVVLPTVTTIYTVTVTGVNGCTAAASDTVYPASPQPPTVGLSKTICQGDTFRWDNHAYYQTGNYTIYTPAPPNGYCDSTIFLSIYVTPLPALTISANPSAPCHTGLVTITATSTNSTYSWNNGITQNFIQVEPAVPTTYICTATSQYGCKAVDSVMVYPAMTGPVTGTYSICAGDTLKAAGHAYTQTGNYSDTLINIYGCDSIVKINLTVLNYAAGAVTAIPPLQQCRNGAVTLTGPAGYTSYLWTTGATTQSILVNPQVSTVYILNFGTTGAYCQAHDTVVVGAGVTSSVYIFPQLCTGDTLQLGGHLYTQTGNYMDTLSNRYGCDSVVNIVLTVNAYPQPVITSGGANDTCHLTPVTLTASGGTGYAWAPGADTTASITVQPVSATVYTVTVSNGSPCIAVDSVTVYPAMDTTIALTASTSLLCAKGEDTICASPGFSGYLWSQGSTTQCIIMHAPGNVSVTVTNSQGCAVNSQVLHVAGDTTIIPDITNYADTLVSSPAVNYQWYLNSNLLTGDTLRDIIALQSGSYYVVVTDAAGCKSQSTSFVITGISAVKAEGFKIYPNPNNTGTWQIEVDESLVGATCVICDEQGNIVYTGKLDATKSTIVTKLAAGIYLLKIANGNNNDVVKLVVF